MLTIDEAREAARHIISGYGPRHRERLLTLRRGPQPWTDLDSEMGPVYGPTDSLGRLTVRRRGLVSQYGGGFAPVMSALTPLGHAVLALLESAAE